MQRTASALLAAVLALPFACPGASRPDFSGTWKMDESRSESAHQAVPIGPVTMVIRQTPSRISIETRKDGNEKSDGSVETLTYNLDGSEIEVAGLSGTPVKTKAHWDGVKLVTETARNLQDAAVTTIYVLALNAGGRELTIAKTLTVQHGYQFPGAKNTGSGQDIFVKIAAPASGRRSP